MEETGLVSPDVKDNPISLTARFWGEFLGRVRNVFAGLGLVFSMGDMVTSQMSESIKNSLKNNLLEPVPVS